MSAHTIRKSARIGIVFTSALFAVASFASDVAEIGFDGHQTNYAFTLDGTKTKTIFRVEEYEGTCTREEEYTDYRQECDYRTVRRCHEESGGQSCHSVPECHETTRPVCNSHGCTNESTHECTTREVCSSEPSRTVCNEEQERTDCRDVPYTATRTVAYSCTKTRMVPVGTELEEEMSANVTIEFTGDLRGLTGKDRFRLSLANGNDLTRPDLTVESASTGDSHFFRLSKISEVKKSVGDRKSVVTAVYKIDAITYASVLAHQTKIGDLDAIRGAISFTTSGDAIDPSVVLSVVAKKDRFFGGLKKDFAQKFKAADLKVADGPSGQNIQVDLGTCLGARPHEFTLSLSRDVNLLLGSGILNVSTIEKAKKDLASTFVKRIKFKGKKSAQCASDD